MPSKRENNYTFDTFQNGEKVSCVIYLMSSKMEKIYFEGSHPLLSRYVLLSSTSYFDTEMKFGMVLNMDEYTKVNMYFDVEYGIPSIQALQSESRVSIIDMELPYVLESCYVRISFLVCQVVKI